MHHQLSLLKKQHVISLGYNFFFQILIKLITNVRSSAGIVDCFLNKILAYLCVCVCSAFYFFLYTYMKLYKICSNKLVCHARLTSYCVFYVKMSPHLAEISVCCILGYNIPTVCSVVYCTFCILCTMYILHTSQQQLQYCIPNIVVS